MYELIVRIARAIACVPRLRILSCVAGADEIMPTDLAQELGMSRDLVAAHLRRLSAAALIQRRRSGVRSYCIASSPYAEHTISGGTAAWLRQVLGDPARAIRDSEVEQVRDCRQLDAQSQLHAVVFDAATAFTDVRRLQILHRLMRGRTATVEMLVRELSMSRPAVTRQTTKLIRRGCVEAGHSGRNLVYRLSHDSKTPIHAELFDIVRRQLDED